MAGFLERVYDLLFFFRRSDMGRLTNQAVFLTVEKAAHLGGGLVLLVAVARLLGEEVLGIYAFAIAATAVFVPVLDAGLNSRAIKQVAGSQDWQAVFDAVAFRRRVGPWIVVLMGGLAWGVGKPQEVVLIVVLVGLSTLAMSLGDAANAAFKGLLQAHYSAITVGATNIGLVVLGVGAMLIDWGLIGVAGVYAFCRVGYFVASWQILTRVIPETNLLGAVKNSREDLRQSVQFLPAVFFIGCLLHLNFLIADWMGEGTDSGFYAIGYRLASALFVLGGASLEGLLAVFAKRSGSDSSFWQVGLGLLGVGILGLVLVQWAAESVTLWVFG
ncbi:MAG: oligosaccharide flippase family protein, partial [Candidatus Latescibacteria bacterium]|nr:oligosaccharide flippase family protein [Candidatus Latescibacterota bacterium]